MRTDPLKHILSLLADLPSVRWVLVENVRGFESSEARKQLASCLHAAHFTLREFLISPVQVGVPNSRTRYYLLAKREPLAFSFQSSTIVSLLTFLLCDKSCQILRIILVNSERVNRDQLLKADKSKTALKALYASSMFPLNLYLRSKDLIDTNPCFGHNESYKKQCCFKM